VGDYRKPKSEIKGQQEKGEKVQKRRPEGTEETRNPKLEIRNKRTNSKKTKGESVMFSRLILLSVCLFVSDCPLAAAQQSEFRISSLV